MTTDYPIFVNGKPTYFIQVVTPTSQIYSGVKELLSTEDVKMFTLLGSTFAAISVLIIILIKWTIMLRIRRLRVQMVDIQPVRDPRLRP